ncbi:hypothetical protein D3C76_1455320 [compost metagenome]
MLVRVKGPGCTTVLYSKAPFWCTSTRAWLLAMPCTLAVSNCDSRPYSGVTCAPMICAPLSTGLTRLISPAWNRLRCWAKLRCT